MKKILLGVAVFTTGIICGLIFNYGPIYAQDSMNDNSVISKLSEVSKNQVSIMSMLNAMNEDIKTIKLRVTQMQ